MSIMDDYNYYNDARVKVAEMGDWFTTFSENTMTATVEVMDEDGEDFVEVEVACKMEVCDLCGGRGRHVNPAIDSGGLSREDLEDEGFRRDYFRGRYDVPCNQCRGRRVVPVVDPKRNEPWVLAAIDEMENERAMSHRERMAELRFGC
jgi:hypothetical protein